MGFPKRQRGRPGNLLRHRKRAPRPLVPILPSYIAKALKAEPKAWAFFQKLAPTHRRNFVVWIHIAKRPETREKRLAQAIAWIAQGKPRNWRYMNC